MPDARIGKADRELVQLIRRSNALDPLLKRQWLRVVDHLTPADRERLRGILLAEQAKSNGEPPATPS
jgi:hypothetical protein